MVALDFVEFAYEENALNGGGWRRRGGRCGRRERVYATQ